MVLEIKQGFFKLTFLWISFCTWECPLVQDINLEIENPEISGDFILHKQEFNYLYLHVLLCLWALAID